MNLEAPFFLEKGSELSMDTHLYLALIALGVHRVTELCPFRWAHDSPHPKPPSSRLCLSAPGTPERSSWIFHYDTASGASCLDIDTTNNEHIYFETVEEAKGADHTLLTINTLSFLPTTSTESPLLISSSEVAFQSSPDTLT